MQKLNWINKEEKMTKDQTSPQSLILTSSYLINPQWIFLGGNLNEMKKAIKLQRQTRCEEKKYFWFLFVIMSLPTFLLFFWVILLPKSKFFSVPKSSNRISFFSTTKNKNLISIYLAFWNPTFKRNGKFKCLFSTLILRQLRAWVRSSLELYFAGSLHPLQSDVFFIGALFRFLSSHSSSVYFLEGRVS